MAYVAAFAAGGASAYQAWQEYKFKGEEADAYRAAGKRTLAAGSREFQEAEREREFMYSRALALAAASGAGVDDPGMVKVLADVQAEGLYQSLSKLWRAQNDAEGAYFRADAAEREQKAIRTLAPLRIATSALTAYSTAGGSFGGMTPPPSGTIATGAMSPIPAGSRAPSILERYKGPFG
jgi:hypothetical protein